jgi:RNA polymerase sigma factor (sigma-70 family)
MRSDEQGRKQLNERQRRALEEFRIRAERDLRSYATSLTGPRFADYAADLVQEVFLKLGNRISLDGSKFVDEHGRAIVNVLGYAKTILTNDYWKLLSVNRYQDSIDFNTECDHREHEKRAMRRLEEFAYRKFFDYERSRSKTTYNHYLTVLQKLIARLDDNMRKMVTMRLLEARDLNEISELTGVQPELVRYTINLARAKLRYWLKQELGRRDL